MESNNEFIIQIENQIRNDQFKSKEDLSQYLTMLTESGQPNQEVEKEQIKKFLDLYDSMHSNDQTLNLEQYKGANLGEQNYIISMKDDKILKTNEQTEKMNEEFSKLQNEITANNKSGMVNADDVFQKMAETQKEELNLISLTEAISMDNIDLEILQKIRYFINNKYINPYEYKIDLESGLFYSIVTKEIFEVRKNEETNEYELYKGGEIVYNQKEQEETNEQELEYQTEEEKELYENRTNKEDLKYVKKRVLTKQTDYPNNRAAFSKMSFLIVSIITFVTLITMIIILNK